MQINRSLQINSSMQNYRSMQNIRSMQISKKGVQKTSDSNVRNEVLICSNNMRYHCEKVIWEGNTGNLCEESLRCVLLKNVLNLYEVRQGGLNEDRITSFCRLSCHLISVLSFCGLNMEVSAWLWAHPAKRWNPKMSEWRNLQNQNSWSHSGSV